MPYLLTRREVIARIAMRALLDSVPGMTQRLLAGLFHASTRTVNDAAKRSVDEWYAVLETAKDAPSRTPPPSPSSKRSSSSCAHPWWNPPVPEQRSFGKGVRARAKLVAVEDAEDGGRGIDMDPSDEGLEEERERQAREAEGIR